MNYSAVVNTYVLHEVLWNLGRLARARLTLNNQDLVLSDGGQEILSVGEYGQAASHFLDGLLLFFSLRELRFLILSASARRGNKYKMAIDNNYSMATKSGNSIFGAEDSG